MQHPVKAKKALGQHFLNDVRIAERIVRELKQAGPSHVIEVGPGTGILTRFLASDPELNCLYMDVDAESIEFLRQTYPQLGERLMLQDFLKYDFDRLDWERMAIIGNFPYNISSQIFFNILDHKDRIDTVVGMLQKEVAERLCAPPGSKTYGILSVLLQAWYKLEYLFTVSEGVFTPPPKVKSAVIRMTKIPDVRLDCDERLFRQVVKVSFNQRRKMLVNSLRSLIDTSLIQDPIMSKRPEQLSVADFVYLTRKCSDVKGKDNSSL